MKKPGKGVLILQAALTAIGAVTALVTLMRTLSSGGDVLNVLNGIVYIAVYAYIVYYGCVGYKRGEGAFIYAVFGYAAVLGIALLFSGNFIKEIGLSDWLTLFINICNLIAFGNVIRFTGVIEDKKKAVAYIGIACGLKLFAELYLIAIMIDMVNPMQILSSLSVPILGITILVAYMNRYGIDR